MFDVVIEALKRAFGRSIVFKGDGSLDVSFVGVFDEVFTYVDPETRARVSTDQLSIVLNLADLPREPIKGDIFEVGETEYLVRSLERDARGATRVFVSERVA